MKRLTAGLLILAAAGLSAEATGAEAQVSIRALTPDGPGRELGPVLLVDSPKGLVLTPSLNGLPPGTHGFHVHENGSCASTEKDGKPVPGGAAGGHFDPAHSGQHLGPEGQGHAGDLPALDVAADGSAHKAVTAPHLTVAQIRGKAVIIHAGGDNYSDTPQPLGGGGARIGCGVIP
jgi:Cu-Zn family superoxide dismutase